jgi:phosphoribosyl 1,2-cyclic phosphodiesterase
LKFWGVRGSIPTPAAENLGFGGNTACVEVMLPSGEALLIDGGTGVRECGRRLGIGRSNGNLAVHMLITHFHWDHIHGIPFFEPLYSSGNEVSFYSHATPEELQEMLEGQMSKPHFPVSFELLAAKRKFIQAREVHQVGSVTVRRFPLNHPQGATGYRLESDGAAIVHASDHEHGNSAHDRVLREVCSEADVLIYDAQYTPEEYDSRRGWGHSTWLEATSLARAARVKHLVLFHHDPSHSDEFLRRIRDQARAHFENTDVAREGWTITV